MRYFNSGGDEDSQNVEVFMEGKTEQDRQIEMVQVSLSAHEVNQNTLAIAVDMMEKSFFWKFRTAKTKLKMVTETYARLQQLI